MSTNPSGRRTTSMLSADLMAAGGFLLLTVVGMSLSSDQFLSERTFISVAFQLPELGLLTLAMMMPIISGGFNLATTFTANIAGLTMAWVLHRFGADAGLGGFLVGAAAALAVGAAAGWTMGMLIARTGAHPILVSLAMMMFLRGLGEFLTRGGDISGFPPIVSFVGNGVWLGVPMPMWIFAVCVLLWWVIMTRSRLGFTTRMIGSNIEATRYSGINTARALTLVYTLSGLMSGSA